ncbi:MAG: hypothetical protein ACE5JX_01225, partial [Acidobacteriota bacterium]
MSPPKSGPNGTGNFLFRILPLVFCLSSPSATTPMAWLQGQSEPRKAPGESRKPADWSEVDRLISEQKFEEAARRVEQLRQSAQESENQADWARALIRETQLRMGLHGYETAVRHLKEEPWPDGVLNRVPLQLFYANSLTRYYRAYSYEISRREQVQSVETVDLRAWTREQIYGQAQEAYHDAWMQREALGREPVDRLAEYLEGNNHPPGTRDTLRDALSYLYVELLADSSLWTARQSNQLHLLDVKGLIAGGGEGTPDRPILLDPSAHPLLKLGRVLDDLEAWHRRNGRPAASLEARLERTRRLHAAFTHASDRKLILEDLEGRLSGYREDPWWAEAMATLAQLIRQGNEAGKLVRAVSLADQGRRAFPDSVGGRRCLQII